MSTLVSEIIVQAFREGNFVAVGQTTTPEEMLEAVPMLNNYLQSLYGIELGEGFRDWYVPSVHDPAAPLRYPLTPTGDGTTSTEPWANAPANVRLVVKSTTAKTVYLSAAPRDGARMSFVDVGSAADTTIDANGRKIEGAATLTLAPADSPRKWMYRGDLGEWVRINLLASTDAVPLPPEFDDLLITGLAMRLAPRFQVEIHPSIAARNADMLARLRKRYKQSENVPSSMELRAMWPSEI